MSVADAFTERLRAQPRLRVCLPTGDTPSPLYAELAARDADPLIRALENCLPPDATAISTVSVCTLLGIRPTSGSARRVARIMRTLGFVPVRSRLLRPGGWRDTVGRGWIRPKINLQAGRTVPRKA